MMSAFEYDADMRVLRLRFTNGTVANYQGVPPEVVDEFERAASKGSYFHRHIADRYVDL